MMGQTDSYTVKGKLSGMSEDIKIIVLDRVEIQSLMP